MTRYFLGVDTGATKSHALIADEKGRAMGFGLAGPGNWEGVGWEGACATLNDIISQATTAAGIGRQQVAAAGFGLAGYDWPEDRPPHVKIIKSLGINGPFALVNDAFIGLLAGSNHGWGVAVTAGTSCNCYGRDAEGRMGRAGGSSYWFAEYAGASELVMRAVQTVAKAWSRRGPPTRLAEAFVEAAGAADVTDLFGGLMRGRYQLGAGDAPLVFETAAQGDEVANEVVLWAGRELGDLALGVIRQLSLEEMAFDVVLSGSFFRGSPLIQETMCETIHKVAPKANLVRLAAPPVIGGVLLGMEQVGLDITAIRPTLIETTNLLNQE